MRTNLMRAPAALALLSLLALVSTFIATDVAAHAKDPCFFSQAEYDSWKTEKSGSPGWGDTAGHLDSVAGCTGLWDAGDVQHCPQANGTQPMTWRVWAQSDGDQVWIAFDDTYPNTPRFHAHCQAGVVRNGTFLASTYVSQS